MNDEADQLLTKYIAQMQALNDAFRIEVTALAWKIAAERLNELMPKTVAVGTLSHDGRETQVVMPAAEHMIAPKTVVHRTNGPKPAIIRGSGKIKILGPKPTNRAESYNQLLASKNGVWARRGSKRVQYACVGWKGTPSGSRPVFYLMKNTKTGKTITVKFDSIVSDWTHHAVNDELQRKTA